MWTPLVSPEMMAVNTKVLDTKLSFFAITHFKKCP